MAGREEAGRGRCEREAMRSSGRPSNISLSSRGIESILDKQLGLKRRGGKNFKSQKWCVINECHG